MLRDRNWIPKFCEHCGTKLVWSAGEPIEHDPDSGRRQVVRKLLCPARKWWQFFFHGHPTRAGEFGSQVPYTKIEEAI